MDRRSPWCNYGCSWNCYNRCNGPPKWWSGCCSYGSYNNFILTTSTGDGPADQADANGYLPKTLLLTSST